MITLHHLNNSRSQRVLWLLEELGLEYRIVRYERDPATMRAPASLRAVHPLGRAPVVTDGDLTLAESGAIVEYLLDRYGDGRFVPLRGTDAHRRYVYWLHFAEATAMPPLLLKLIFDRLSGPAVPWIVRPVSRAIAARVKTGFVQPQIDENLDHMERTLERGDWFAGDAFSAADVQMSFPVEAAHARGGLDSRRPRLLAWLDRIHARTAYRRAIERGGEYALMR